jgi:hypothetical protein
MPPIGETWSCGGFRARDFVSPSAMKRQRREQRRVSQITRGLAASVALAAVEKLAAAVSHRVSFLSLDRTKCWHRDETAPARGEGCREFTRPSLH